MITKTRPFLVRTILSSLALLVSACGMMQRSSDSGYASSKQTSHRRSIRESHGQIDENISANTRLKTLENSLSTKKELEQYSKALPWFSDASERIEFLQLADFEERQHWLTQKNFPERAQRIQNQMAELIEAQDIALGMPQSSVKKSWGDPDGVEVSGNPLFHNERWRYNKYVSTNDGYKPEKKIVYFEGGKVVGWEVE